MSTGKIELEIDIMAEAIQVLSFHPRWFDVPLETSIHFFPTFVRVSMALQEQLRRVLPECYLSDLERFKDIQMVYPLLVYSASHPFPGEPRTDLTYDVLNRDMMRSFYFSVRQELPTLLRPIFRRLRAAGLKEIAAYYRPDRSTRIITMVQRLKKTRRRLYHIVMMEGRMVNDLAAFAGSRELRPRMQIRIANQCRKRLLMGLRRIYAKYDFTGPAQEIVDRITEVLR